MSNTKYRISQVETVHAAAEPMSIAEIRFSMVEPGSGVAEPMSTPKN
jgi:hypothetical protein